MKKFWIREVGTGKNRDLFPMREIHIWFSGSVSDFRDPYPVFGIRIRLK
jgi:hypothetical protein